MNTCQIDGLVVQRPQTTPSAPGHPGHQTWQCVISSCGFSSRTMFTSHHIQKHCQNCESASTPQSGTSHKTCLGGFGGNGSIVWTSATSHMGRTSNAFKVTMKLQTFLFQMVVTSCISVQYLWKYGFAKSSDNLYPPCILSNLGMGGLRIHNHLHYCNPAFPIRILCSVVLPKMPWSPFNPHAGQGITVLHHRAHHLQCCFCN